MFTQAELYRVKYTSLGGETSERDILLLELPSKNIKAIDVSDFDVEDRLELQNLFRQYLEYKDAFMARMFSFDKWIEHTTGWETELKYRTFVPENLKLSED